MAVLAMTTTSPSARRSQVRWQQQSAAFSCGTATPTGRILEDASRATSTTLRPTSFATGSAGTIDASDRRRDRRSAPTGRGWRP